jgi:hypothetical protein
LQEKTVTKNSKLSNIVFLLFFLSIAIAICFNVIDEVLEISIKSLGDLLLLFGHKKNKHQGDAKNFDNTRPTTPYQKISRINVCG